MPSLLSTSSKAVGLNASSSTEVEFGNGAAESRRIDSSFCRSFDGTPGSIMRATKHNSVSVISRTALWEKLVRAVEQQTRGLEIEGILRHSGAQAVCALVDANELDVLPPSDSSESGRAPRPRAERALERKSPPHAYRPRIRRTDTPRVTFPKISTSR